MNEPYLKDCLESMFLSSQQEEIKSAVRKSGKVSESLDGLFPEEIKKSMHADDFANFDHIFPEVPKIPDLESLPDDILFSLYCPPEKKPSKIRIASSRLWYYLNKPIPYRAKRWFRNSWAGRQIEKIKQKKAAKRLAKKKALAARYLCQNGVSFVTLIRDIMAENHDPMYKELGILPKGGYSKQTLEDVILDLNSRETEIPYYMTDEYKAQQKNKQQERIRKQEAICVDGKLIKEIKTNIAWGSPPCDIKNADVIYVE